MELLFYWIAKHKKLENLGFNFSPRYNITFELDKRLLRIEMIENSQDDFWGENIKNMTLILGKNGSGKTSVLEGMYKPYLRDGVNKPTAIYLFERNQDNQNTLVLYKPFDWKIDISRNLKIETIDYLQEHGALKDRNQFEFYRQLYYCPIFRGSFFDGSFDNEYNLATDNKLYHFVQRVENYNLDIFYRYNQYETFWKCRFLVNFLEKWHSLSLFNTFPPLEVTPISFDENNAAFRNPVKREVLRRFEARLDNLANRYENESFKINILVERFVFLSALGFIQVTIRNCQTTKLIERFLLKDIDILSAPIEAIYNAALNLISDLKVREIISSKDLIGKINSFVSKFGTKITSTNPTFPSIKFENLTTENLAQLEPIFDLNNHNINCFTFSLSGLSSGEDYILTMFSRLYEKNRNDANNKKSILLLLDEGEITLHPEWQRRYISSIINVIPKIFPVSSIQIILTSNNPIIASDFPKNNIIFLDKDDNGKTKISSRDNHKDTFAANIHDLYNDAFYLESSIGKHAMTRITELVDFLKSRVKKNNKYDRDSSLKLIQIVGDEIIKARLMELWRTKFDKVSKKERIKSEIENLKNQLKELP